MMCKARIRHINYIKAHIRHISYITKILTVQFVATAMLLSALSHVQAESLKDVSVSLSNDLPYRHRSYFTVFFTTGSAGTITTITMSIFGASTGELESARLLEIQTVPDIAGLDLEPGTAAVGGGLFTYTLNTPANVPIDTRIKVVIGDMPNVRWLDPTSLNGRLKINTIFQGGGGDEGIAAYVLREIQAGDIGTDAVTGDELAGVTNLKFGQCLIDPPKIADSSDLYIHTECKLTGISGRINVIAFPGGQLNQKLHPRLVPKGSYAHCLSDNNCHIDVVIKNAAPAPGNVDDGPRQWVWIAWTN